MEAAAAVGLVYNNLLHIAVVEDIPLHIAVEHILLHIAVVVGDSHHTVAAVEDVPRMVVVVAGTLRRIVVVVEDNFRCNCKHSLSHL